MEFDFIVIGAGPIGSYLAKLLAEGGYSVGIFDKKKEIGERIVCSGIIGINPYSQFDLPKDAVINEISAIKILSPSLIEFQYSQDSPFAYVTDRKTIDKALFSRAQKEGVEPFLENMVIDLDHEKDRVCVKYLKKGNIKKESARCVIITTGTNFTLHRKVGLVPPKRLLWGRRIEFDQKCDGPVEIYILNSPYLGAFGWVIPLENQTRIGVLSERNDGRVLHDLIRKNNGRFNIPEGRIDKAPIVCGDSKKMVSDRAIVVGEAAGQVKTTTGGGIHYGLIGASIANRVLLKAARANDFSRDFLLEYEKLWRNKMGKEIKSGIILRNLISKISPSKVDKVFNHLKNTPSINDKIKENFSFDYHKGIIELGMDLLLGRSKKRCSKLFSKFL